MERLANLSSQLQPNNTSAKDKFSQKHPDDVVIVAAYRTPLTKGGKGGQKDVSSGELLEGLLSGMLEKTKLDPALIGDVAVGNCLNPSAGVNEHRAACLSAGIPYTVPFKAVNRQCSSGLIAVNDIANAITAGQIDIGIGAGAESMSNNYGKSAPDFPERFLKHPEASKCLIPMGFTSENVADKYKLSREVQDKFAASSYAKAAKAQDGGLFDDEIIPINAKQIGEDDKETFKLVTKDDGIRRGVTAESLAKIKPAFKKTGSTHAGNASQITDGAAAVLLMRRSVAEKLKQPILAKFVHCKVVGVAPEEMGIGLGVAIKELMKELQITPDDVDLFEMNEAFASQCVQSMQACNIPEEKVNVKGGAIAIGHPLGCTGARQIATILPELKRQGKKVAITGMCVGGGQGAASLIVAE